MKKLYSLLALLAFCTTYAQPGDQLYAEEQVDSRPQFSKGTRSFVDFIEKQHDGGKQMINEIAIVVEKDGSVSNMEINGVEGKFPVKETQRLVRLSPKWTPAKKSGMPVRCRVVWSRIARFGPRGEPDSELSIDAVPNMPKSGTREDDLIYNAAGVDEKPEFPGGMSLLYKYLKNNFAMPSSESTGRVIVSLIVEKDGTLTDIKIVRNMMAAEYATEMIRVLKKSPRWKAAVRDKKAVRCAFTFPVAFPIVVPDTQTQQTRDKN